MFEGIEALKAQIMIEEKAAKDAQPRYAMLKSRSAGITASSIMQMSEIARFQMNQAQQKAMQNLTAASPLFQAVESTAEGRNSARNNVLL